MRRRLSLLGLLMAALVGMAAASARATDDLVADLSNHLVAITTGFAGTNVLLFGAIEGDGDVVVVVRGPEHSELVRRKGRTLGVWMNKDEMRFASTPIFYADAASRPIAEILPKSARDRHQIGVDHLKLSPPEGGPAAEVGAFRDALVRNKQTVGLYGRQTGKVVFLGKRLFRTDMHFPANAPVGTYKVEVYLVRSGLLASASVTPLIISKVGLEAAVFDFAHRYSVAYGLLAIAVAVMAGWAAGVVFRKG